MQFAQVLPRRSHRPESLTLFALAIGVLCVACNLGTYEAKDAGPAGDATPTVPIEAACSSPCHGSQGSAAPPVDTAGNTETSSRGVGAHRSHLGTSDWRRNIECSECHVVPLEIGSEGHIDDGLPAELQLTGFLQNTDWNGTTCSNNYCHGSTLTGGVQTEPEWTVVDGSASGCGSCHGLAPPAPHPDNTDCGQCHPTMNPGEGLVIAYPALHIDGKLDVNESAPCDTCHGSDGVSAPPTSVDGLTATTERAVGAHRSHLGISDWHKEVECSECHQVPTSTVDIGHVDSALPAELTFGLLAGDATWDGTTCSNSYCHGGTLSGGANRTPEWTVVDGTQSQCSSCHGAPPPAPHPTSSECADCHPTMVAGAGLVIAYPELHIDGKVDLTDDQPCDSCHGSGGIAAPPLDIGGNDATTERGVGAHRAHVEPSSWRKDMSCNECHIVPGATLAIGHMDTPLPAEITFGALAGNASWNGGSCSNTYCHGTTLSGGVSTNPLWTQVDGSQGQCNSCHGAPPPAPHPSGSDCGQCHDTMTPGAGLVITDPTRHIDGNLDVTGDLACDGCHGSGGIAAPPSDTTGNTNTTTRGVGSHRNHLGVSDWHQEIACSACHLVPQATGAVGHIDSPLPAELTFSALAGSTAQFNGTTCTNSYCHGSTLEGGQVAAPQWTLVDGTQSQCDSCHGAPPPAPHPVDADCGKCHPSMTQGGGLTITNAALHINGSVEVSGDLACDSCHGGGGSPAPPTDVGGSALTTSRGVGAHQAHLIAGDWYKPIQCAQCHQEPGSTNAVGHTDTPLPAELTFGPLATGTTWNGSSCSNNYCHGGTTALQGGALTTPVWTSTASGASDCGACHGTPPPAPHPTNPDCESCHGEVVGPGMVIINPNLHIDGVLQVIAVHPPGWAEPGQHGSAFNTSGVNSCNAAGCHGPALTGGASGIACTDCHSSWQTDCTFCHGGTDNLTGAPPLSLLDQVNRSIPAVGAHSSHVEASGTHGAFDCGACHLKPSSALSPAHIEGSPNAELLFSSLNSVASYSGTTCTNLYCHGNGRQNNGSESWTSTTALGCASCHPGSNTTGDTMSGEHKKHIDDEGMRCSECHQSVVNTSFNIIAPPLHVNGVKDIEMTVGGTWNPANKSCSNVGGGCHEDDTERW